MPRAMQPAHSRLNAITTPGLPQRVGSSRGARQTQSSGAGQSVGSMASRYGRRSAPRVARTASRGRRRTVPSAIDSMSKGFPMGTRHRGKQDEIRALDAYVKLSRAAAAVEASVNRPLAAAGLTLSQFGVLEALWHLGPLSPGALARKILKSPANLTTVLDNLERRELIARSRDASDRRVTIVALTDDGRAHIAALFP